MHNRTERVLQYLDETKAELRQAVDDVPAGLRERRPAEDRWSVADVVEHLCLVEQRIGEMAAAQVAAGRSHASGSDASAAEALDDLPGTSADIANRPPASFDPAWSALEQAREAVRRAVLSGDGLGLGELVVPHSVSGHLNLYHWIAFVGAQELRHAALIREITGELQSPHRLEPEQILSAARRILLVDWPSADVPRTLLSAGLAVFGYSPAGYSVIEIGKDATLAFRRIDGCPEGVDIVSTYRPAEELPAIIQDQVLRCGAQTMWLQPPTASHEARQIAGMHGLRVIEGVDIAAAARAVYTAAP